MSHMKLRVPQHVYELRLERMAKLIALKAPPVIIYHEARLIQRAYCPNWWNRLKSAFLETRIGSFLNLWADPEWIRFKLTGKSEFYAPDIEPERVPDDLYHPDNWSPETLERLLHAKTPTLSYDAETEAASACSQCRYKHLGLRQHSDCPCACHH